MYNDLLTDEMTDTVLEGSEGEYLELKTGCLRSAGTAEIEDRLSAVRRSSRNRNQASSVRRIFFQDMI